MEHSKQTKDSGSSNQIQSLERLSEITDTYDVFVFPIFGTLHNGHSLSESAFLCLQNLSELGKTVAICSNVPKRRHVLIQDLAALGVSPSLYQHVITSGEEAYHSLKERSDPFHAKLGQRAYVYGSSNAFRMLDGLCIEKTTFLDEADFLLALGPDEWHSELDHYKPSLRIARRNDLPMVCVSPDLYVEYGGNRSIRAGSLAYYYESLGGDVFYHGKPYRPFYMSLLKDLAPFQKQDILMVGDSYLTDIKGASKMGLASLLCLNATTKIDFELSGIKSDYLKRKQKQLEIKKSINPLSVLKALLAEQDYAPTYIMENIRW